MPEVLDPCSPLITEELFAPVLHAYAYADRNWSETLHLVDESMAYGLTGAVFAADKPDRFGRRRALVRRRSRVGHQRQGRRRVDLIRFARPRATKRNHLPVRDYRYPHLEP